MVSISHFDEKSGIVPFKTEWGRWWQTVDEVHIELTNLDKIKSRDISVQITPNGIKCMIRGNAVLQGNFYRLIHADEAVWTIEDGVTLSIVLPKADYVKKEIVWEALFLDGRFKPDQFTLNEMRKKIDLEKFQIENPSLDFSGAKLAKSYDNDNPHHPE